MPTLALTNFEGITCDMSISVPVPGVLLLEIAGHDVGEFGRLPTERLEHYLKAQRAVCEGREAVELFIDARYTRTASIDVSGEWALWLARQRRSFRSIHMLTGSRFIHMTAHFVRRFAGLEGLMSIHSDPARFDRALLESIGFASRP